MILCLFLQVDELISNTLLNVDMEEKVYTSVINWVKHEPSERKKYVARVRFSNTQQSFIFPTIQFDTYRLLLMQYDAFALSDRFNTHQWTSVETFGVKGNKENTNPVTWINRIWKEKISFILNSKGKLHLSENWQDLHKIPFAQNDNSRYRKT